MKRLALLLALVLAVPSVAQASGGNGFGYSVQSAFSFGVSPGYGHRGPQLPVFLAAPWYLYWPYDAHFMTPAPVAAPFFAPPAPGNYPAQPYIGPVGGYGEPIRAPAGAMPMQR